MSGTGPGRTPPAGIPTLTEVVPWPGQAPIAPLLSPQQQVPPAVAHPPAVIPAAAPAASPATSAVPVAAPEMHVAAPVSAPASPPATPSPAPVAPAAVVAASAPAVPINEAQLTQRILADLQRQIDLMLEVRLREALAPVLARATDALIRDARKELTSAMRDAVARSVAQELARRENR